MNLIAADSAERFETTRRRELQSILSLEKINCKFVISRNSVESFAELQKDMMTYISNHAKMFSESTGKGWPGFVDEKFVENVVGNEGLPVGIGSVKLLAMFGVLTRSASAGERLGN